MQDIPRELTPEEIMQVSGGLRLTPILTAFTLIDMTYDFCKGVADGYSQTAN